MLRSGLLGPITIEESPASDDTDLPISQSSHQLIPISKLYTSQWTVYYMTSTVLCNDE